jgi:hypothetical protein
MKNEQPRLDDAVQRLVKAKYNKLQAKGLCAIRLKISMQDKRPWKKGHKYHKQTFNRHLQKNYHLNYLLSTLSQTQTPSFL